ncbi:MAG: nitrite reductase small subunit NirD [Casimicrobiaceae bacterium]
MASPSGRPHATNTPVSATFVAVCALEDIPVAGARVIARPGHPDGDVAVFRCDPERVFAIVDRCPHKGGPLSQGIVYGDRVACPLHNWSVGLADGEAVAPDVGCARTFPVRIEHGTVYVALD